MVRDTKKESLNFIDIFSGAGGLSCGLELAGMNCLLGIDHDQHAMNTFAKNHTHALTFCEDICQLTPKLLRELTQNRPIHAVVGGPPCQGFSTAGIGDPEDIRNNLFMQFVRLVKIANPHFILIENVTGLVAKKNEKTLKAIFQQFHKLGYNLDVQVMSAEQYGVPEKRRRTIILGTKLNPSPLFPTPTHAISQDDTYIPPMTVGDALKNLQDGKKEIMNHDLAAAQIKSIIDLKRIKKIPEGKGIRYQHDEIKYLPQNLRLGIDWNSVRENRFRQTKYFRLDRAKPSPTIMTSRCSYFHPTENRYLTPREGACLQSFPHDFEFTGPLSAQWKQIGNAVPPLLAKALGQAMIDMYHASAKSRKNKPHLKHVEKTIKNIRKKAFEYK